MTSESLEVCSGYDNHTLGNMHSRGNSDNPSNPDKGRLMKMPMLIDSVKAAHGRGHFRVRAKGMLVSGWFVEEQKS